MLICTSVGRCGLSVSAYYRVLLQFLWHILTHSCQAIPICVAEKAAFYSGPFPSHDPDETQIHSGLLIFRRMHVSVCMYTKCRVKRNEQRKCVSEMCNAVYEFQTMEIVAQNALSIKIEMNEMCNSLLEWVPIEIRMCVLVQIVL